jgi:hypothetical protein
MKIFNSAAELKVFSRIVGIYIIAALLISQHAQASEVSVSLKNPNKVQEISSGKETAANAAWWGFDENDSTVAIQQAINSGASKVIIPYVGKDWVVGPIKLAGNQEIIFEPGVVVVAKKGEFKGVFDCLFSGISVSNITLQGYGAVLKMRKDDYRSLVYPKSEHRHVLEFRSCENIKILGLRLESSGGDGIFIGTTTYKPYLQSKNVEIRDCICDNNFRQGISVTSIDGLLIDNCVLKNTSGTSPEAGIDIEPNDFINMIVNAVISNCVSENNGGSGFIASVSNLSDKSRDVSLLFVNCIARNCTAPGMRFRSASKDYKTEPKGLIEFRNCVSEGISYSGAFVVWDKPSMSLKLRFSDCKLNNVAKRRQEAPIYLNIKKRATLSEYSGVEFSNCYLYDELNRPFLKIADIPGGVGLYDVKGQINVCNPYGAKMDSDSINSLSGLKVKNFKRN